METFLLKDNQIMEIQTLWYKEINPNDILNNFILSQLSFKWWMFWKRSNHRKQGCTSLAQNRRPRQRRVISPGNRMFSCHVYKTTLHIQLHEWQIYKGVSSSLYLTWWIVLTNYGKLGMHLTNIKLIYHHCVAFIQIFVSEYLT